MVVKKYSVDKYFLLVASFDQGMNGHGSARATHSVLYIILEVTLDNPHKSLESRYDLSRQSAIVALLHQKKVLRFEGRLRVPHVDIGLA